MTMARCLFFTFLIMFVGIPMCMGVGVELARWIQFVAVLVAS